MSLSGWRPAVVRSASSRKRAPAFGPRWTTSRAEPCGSASTAARSSCGRPPPSGSPRRPAADQRHRGVRGSGTRCCDCVRRPAPGMICASSGERVPRLPIVPIVRERPTLTLDVRLRTHGFSRAAPAIRPAHGRVSADRSRGTPPRRAARRPPTGRQPELDHPALAVRVGVDRLGLPSSAVVAGGDRAGQRRVHLADALGRLHLAARLPGLDGRARLRAARRRRCRRARPGRSG